MSKRNPNAEQYVEQGKSSYILAKQSHGKYSYHYQNALNQFNAAISIEPLDEEIYYLRANVLVALERFKEALEDLDKTLKLNSQYEKAYYVKGVVLSKLGEQEKAAECFSKVLEINPDNADVKGMFAYNSGNYQESVEYFSKILTQYPQDVDIICYMGDALYNLGKYQEALEQFSNVEKIIPNLSTALYGQGLVNYKLKNYNSAYTFFSKSINFGDSKYYAAKIAYDLHADEEVIRILGECSTSKEYNIKGLSLYRLKNYWGAASVFEKAMQMDQDNAELYISYANLLFEVNDLEGALSYYDRAKLIDEGMAKAYYGKYKVLSVLWKKKEAIESLDKAIELDPDNIVLYLCEKSSEYMALGENKEAAYYLNKAYDIAKDRGLNVKTSNEEMAHINDLLAYYKLENRVLDNIITPLTIEVKEIVGILKHNMFQNDEVNTCSWAYEDYSKLDTTCDARTIFYENSHD